MSLRAEGENELGPVDAAVVGEAVGWRIVGASVRGTSHERTGQECQDAHSFTQLTGGIDLSLVAVADGAGSAPLGAAGAETAARAAVAYLDARFRSALPEGDDAWQEQLREAVIEARRAVQQEATLRNVEARELATTLIVMAAAPGLVAVAQVGDGAVVVRDSGGEVRALTHPGSQEFVNHTTFITADNALEAIQLVLSRGAVTGLAVLTDGLQRLALRMPEGIAHAPFFAPLFRFSAGAVDPEQAHRQLEAFLTSPRISERTDDDLTLVLAAPVGVLS